MEIPELFLNKKFRFLLLSLVIILPLEFLSFFDRHLPFWIELPVLLTLIIFFGRDVFRSGIKSLFRFNFADINLLMTIAVLGALYVRQFEEAAIIVVLFAVGNALEDFGVEKSQAALETLISKSPKSALVKGKEEKVPIEEIEIGEVLIVKPGDQIALDGEVVSGDSLIDEAVITGEQLPKNKHIGDMVYAGTINGHGYLEIKVTKTAKDTTLAKIIELTYKSAEKKSQSQQFIEKFATFYTPAVVVVALFLVVIPVFVFHQPFDRWLMESLTLLIISCPCALVISTPITIFSAIGNASKRGVLVKGGQYIEKIGKVRAIAFDKTRTLTKGEPVVTDIIPFNGATKEELLACTAGMEAFSEHPLAQSIIKKAKEENLELHTFTNFKAVSGKGLKGDCNICLDKHHCIGTIKFITEEHEVEKKVIDTVSEFEKQGKTAIVVNEGQKVLGVIGITDEIRKESKVTINTLLQLKIRPIMLTGDNEASAQYIAKELGISEVKASLLPEDKVAALKELMREFKTVAMIGDGVNDAPALASSSVGIAMGAVGSDVAIENADVALMNDNIGVIPFLILLGRKSVQTVRFNIFSAITVKAVFILLAVAGYSNLALAIFADVGITILIVGFSLRLFNFKAGIVTTQ